MDRTSEEGCSSFKEKMVEYFPLLFFGPFCKNRKAFCLRVFSVSKISGHIWVKWELLIVGRFYIALFLALDQTHCAGM